MSDLAQSLRTMADNLWSVEHRIDVDEDAALLQAAAKALDDAKAALHPFAQQIIVTPVAGHYRIKIDADRSRGTDLVRARKSYDALTAPPALIASHQDREGTNG